jgi:lipooligosaccharide transport system permease protein
MSAVVLQWRVAPPLSGRARRLVARNARAVSHFWWVPLSGLAEPVFYLLSIGIGLGKLVGGVPGPNHHVYKYATYVAPALLAASAMNGAIYECTFNVYFKLKYAKVYDAVLATPMRAMDVAGGEIITALSRGAVYSVVFVVMMAGLGDVASGWAALAMPAALLIGFGFAATAMAATTYMRGWTDFDMVNLVMLPMFLFSTTFYPLSTYPRWLQVVVECTPLYHGVVLERGLSLGAVGPALIGHAAYLAVMGLAGLVVAGRRIRILLLS